MAPAPDAASHAPRLYLTTPLLDFIEQPDFIASCADWVKAVDIACLRLNSPAEIAAIDKNILARTQQMIAPLQALNIAIILGLPPLSLDHEGQIAAAPEIADNLARHEFDGVHIPANETLYQVWAEHLGDGYIIGAQADLSRHDAMTLGEAGASYVSLDAATPEGVAMVHWWTELFEPPCVAEIGAPAEDRIEELTAVRADFIALPVDLTTPLQETGAHLRRLARALTDNRPA